MELIWEEIEAVRLSCQTQAQVRVSGEMPSPEGRTPLGVPACTARLAIDKAEPGQDEVFLTGRILALVTAFDEEGRPFAYESTAGFEHTAEAPGAQPGMTAEAEGYLQTLRVFPSGSGVMMEADAEVDIRVLSRSPMKVMGGVSGVNDLEMKRSPLSCTRKVKVGSDTLRLREEIAAEAVSEVISCEGLVTVRVVTPEQGEVCIGGVISVSAVVLETGGRVCQLVRQVPFRERIASNAYTGELSCRATLDSVYMHALGEEFGLLALEAEVSFELWSEIGCACSVPADAFSPTIGFDALTEKTVFTSALGRLSRQTGMKETLLLPEDASDLKEPLFVSTHAVVTQTEIGRRETTLRGVIATAVTYENVSGHIVTFSEDVPFEIQLENECGANEVRAQARSVACAAGYSERSIQVQYTLALNAELERREALPVLVGLAEKEKEKEPGGIMIRFASEGEEVFDVAKRYSAPCESVRRLNPDVKEPFSEGERLIMLV